MIHFILSRAMWFYCRTQVFSVWYLFTQQTRLTLSGIFLVATKVCRTNLKNSAIQVGTNTLRFLDVYFNLLHNLKHIPFLKGDLPSQIKDHEL